MSTPKKPWYKCDKVEVAAAIFAELSRIQQEQRERYNRNIRCLKLYGSQDYSGVMPSVYSQSTFMPENRVRYNVISSCVDTVCSKISKLKTKVTFLTAGGTWEAQQKAKQLTKFMYGLFTQNNVWKLHQKSFKDETIFDLGATKNYRIGNRICSERVLPTEIHFDLVDCVYGTPLVMYQTKSVDKDVLIDMFPERKKIINSSNVVADPYTPSMLDLSGQVTVIEAWRLPSSPDAGDGRHVICCNTGWLVDEEWEKSYFPFTFHKWTEMPVGFYSQSLADRLTGNQVEINKILRTIQRSLHLGAVYKVFLEYGSKVVKEQFNNEIGTLIYYAGTAPRIEVPKVISEEMFRHLNWLIDKAYEETGVSQLSASAKKPSGLDARVALREYQDIETERFALVGQAYEDSYLETARQYIDLAKEIDAEGLTLEVVAESKRFVEKINWKDVAVEGNEMILQKFPTSSLPNTPSGRLQYVQELIESGMVDPKWALHLLDLPDTESYVSLQTAGLEMVLDIINEIVAHGNYMAPEPYMDLETGITLMQAAYNRGRIDKIKEDRLEMMRTWMSNANSQLDIAKQQAQVQAMAAQGMASGQPGMAPGLGAAPQAPASTQQLAPTGGISPTDQVLTG